MDIELNKAVGPEASSTLMDLVDMFFKCVRTGTTRHRDSSNNVVVTSGNKTNRRRTLAGIRFTQRRH